jgi:hypothetical protein
MKKKVKGFTKEDVAKGSAFAKVMNDLMNNNRATVDFKVNKYTAVLKDDMVEININLKMPMVVWYKILNDLNPKG